MPRSASERARAFREDPFFATYGRYLGLIAFPARQAALQPLPRAVGSLSIERADGALVAVMIVG